MTKQKDEQAVRFLTVITKLELGGAQQVALNTLAQLDNRRYKKYLISGQGGFLDDQARMMPGLNTLLWKSFRHPIRPLCDCVTLFRLIHFIKKHRITVVHTHSSKAGLLGRLAARLAGVPMIIHTIHGWPFHDYQNKLVRWFYIRLEQLAAKMSHVLIAVSASTREKGLAHGIGTPEQYHVIYPGSELSAFAPADESAHRNVRQEFGFAPDAPLVGMVACLKAQKAPVDFVRASKVVLQNLPEARFLLVGDGVERKAVEKTVKSLGMEEVFILAGWREDVARLMPAFDILALTSLWEGLPCVLGQAMACAVPIVATDVEGAREAVLQEKTGLLVPPGQPDVTAQAIIRLLQDKALRQRMGKQGRIEAEKFSLVFMAKQLDDLYKRRIQQ